MLSYSLSLLATLLVCFAVQSAAMNALGGRIAKSESNYFSSLARIQAGVKGKPEIMLLGSSITGRLPDRRQGYEGISNMGCDGGSAVDVLMAMDSGILPQSPVIVIEANSLIKAMEVPRTEISNAMEGWWFRTGLRCSALRASSRPSAFIYGMLLGHRIGATERPDQGGTLGHRTLPAAAPAQSAVLSDPDARFVTGLSAVIKRLGQRGSRFVIVWLPPKRGDLKGLAHCSIVAQALARETGALWWDLAEDSVETVRLTDGVHMDASSAAKTSRSLLEALR